MFSYIYKFIYDVLMGEMPSEHWQDVGRDLSVLLTFFVIILFVFILIKLVKWAFDIPFTSWRIRK